MNTGSQVAVVSAGRGNVFGHPAPEVMRRLAATGALIWRTDEEGAVEVASDGAALLVRTARRPGRTVRLPVPPGATP